MTTVGGHPARRALVQLLRLSSDPDGLSGDGITSWAAPQLVERLGAGGLVALLASIGGSEIAHVEELSPMR
ncbi:MAG: hypothetical protein JJE52_04860 [Acidimicrobiia bacterium]|nr:hypothetical protein [Acidimicrobiia bacterium]